MIDIQEYLKICRYSHPEFRGAKDGIISKFFHQNTDLSTLIEVYTAEVYPQCLNLGGKEHLIWDQSFWGLYKRFLVGSWGFTPEKTSIAELSNFISTIQNLFLSLRFSKLPAYSCYFATQYHKINTLIPNFRNLSDPDIENKIFGVRLATQFNDLAQIHVFYHELYHYKYRKNNKLLQQDLKIVRSLFQKYNSVLSSFPADDPRNSDHFWNTYKYFADIQSDEIIEELCCDIFAIVDFVNERKECDIQELIAGYLNTIRYVIEMQKIFTYSEKRWEQIICIFKDMETNVSNKAQYLSTNNDMLNIVHARAGIVFDFACRILGVDITTMPKNDLFDSESYLEALEKSLKNWYDSEYLGVISVYMNDLTSNFSPTQLRATRDLLIGWY